MKVRLNRLTAKENKVINHQVDLACIESAASFELADDICFIYTLMSELGYGPKRAKRIYAKYWELRDAIQTYVRAEGENNSIEDGLRESLMEFRLQQKGIDVRKWKGELGEKRLQVNIKK